MPRRPATVREHSYGGVAVRDDQVVAIVPRGKEALGLPKGRPDEGESGEQAAVREVREEAGIEVRVIDRLGDVRYWYRRKGTRIHKTVTFYLCEYLGGDVADHDHEVDDARWIDLEEARTALSYPGEREMVERALTKLRADR